MSVLCTSLVAVDNSERIIEEAQLTSRGDIKFVAGSARQLPFAADTSIDPSVSLTCGPPWIRGSLIWNLSDLLICK